MKGVSSYSTISVKEKKCCTCPFWEGLREIEFSANKPQRIKADATGGNCMATKTKKTPSSTCPKWQAWEKL